MTPDQASETIAIVLMVLAVFFMIAMLIFVMLGETLAEVFSKPNDCHPDDNRKPGPPPSAAYARWYREEYPKERGKEAASDHPLHDREID